MAEAQAKTNGVVRAIVDYGGLAAFFCTYFVTKSMITATWGLVAGSAVALAVGWLFEKRLAPLPLFGGLAALVFGGLTLIFNDPIWVKLKATVINLALAGVMLGGVALGKNPLKALLSSAFPLPPESWRRLTIRYGVFFLCMAALNEVVWRTQPESVWVIFRFPGLQILSLVFALSQVPMMMRDMKAVEAAAELEP